MTYWFLALVSDWGTGHPGEWRFRNPESALA